MENKKVSGNIQYFQVNRNRVGNYGNESPFWSFQVINEVKDYEYTMLLFGWIGPLKVPAVSKCGLDLFSMLHKYMYSINKAPH